MNNVGQKILVAPLDWGLGHATRCIPVIVELQKQGAEVLIASNGRALALLKIEFPQLKCFELPAYDAYYSRRGPLALGILLQLPKFISAIRLEHQAIECLVREHQLDGVISDNRFCCWTRLATTVFITHQVNIQLPPAFRWMSALLNYFNHLQIRKFDHCWIPDSPDEKMTGVMTEPVGLSVRFVGVLSRFQYVESRQSNIDILALISGPEPQRSVFEDLVRVQLARIPGRKMLVKGHPGREEELSATDELIEVNHLVSNQLQDAIERSALVICRSGYSSVMDLAVLRKKVVFIPTPGQTEQELLAREMKRRGIAYFQSQNQFDLAEALEKSKTFTGFVGWNSGPNLLSQAIHELLSRKN